MSLSSEGMPLLRLWSLLRWAKTETQARGMTPRELLNYLRDVICDQVLVETDPADTLDRGARPIPSVAK